MPLCQATRQPFHVLISSRQISINQHSARGKPFQSAQCPCKDGKIHYISCLVQKAIFKYDVVMLCSQVQETNRETTREQATAAATPSRQSIFTAIAVMESVMKLQSNQPHPEAAWMGDVGGVCLSKHGGADDSVGHLEYDHYHAGTFCIALLYRLIFLQLLSNSHCFTASSNTVHVSCAQGFHDVHIHMFYWQAWFTDSLYTAQLRSKLLLL